MSDAGSQPYIVDLGSIETQVNARINLEIKQQKFPIIKFTTSKHERDVQKGIELVACAYVTKPLDFDEFE